MTDYFWFGGTPGARKPDVYLEDPASGARLGNTPVTVRDAESGAVLSDFLDSNGQPATQIASDANGYLTFAATASYVFVDGGSGTWAFYSDGAVADAIAALPKLDAIAASAAASAYSASLARAAAEAVQVGSATTDASLLTTGTLAPARLPDLSGTYATAAALSAKADAAALTAKADKAGPEIAGKVAKGDLTLNVKDYGAVGNGTADDTAALQAALDVALTRSVRVLVPAGTYKITATLRANPGTTLDLDPQATVKNGGGVNLMLTNGSAASSFTGYTGANALMITGGVWDCGGATASTYQNCFAFIHGHGITVRDTTVKNVASGHGIEFNACRASRAINVKFDGFYDPLGTTATYAEAIQLDLARDTGVYPWNAGAFDGTACSDVLVQGCWVGSTSAAGKWPRGVGSHAALTNAPHTGVKVIGNHFDTTSCAVRAYNWSRFTVTGNTCVGGGVWVRSIYTGNVEDTKTTAGVQTGASANIGPGVIASNVITHTATDHDAIWLDGEATGRVRYVAITGNTVNGTGAGRKGIAVSYGDGATVTGNVVLSAADHGVYVANSPTCAITSNRVVTPVNVGINLDVSSLYCTIIGNLITDSGSHGIFVSGGSTGVAVKNNTVYGFSTTTNLGANGMRVSACDNVQVIGNKFVKGAATNQGAYGLWIANTCNGCQHMLNDLRTSGATASLRDDGIGSVTTVGDLV